MISNFNGYQAYQKNKYETASPHRLITMLYDGAIRFMNQSIANVQAQDIEATNLSLSRAQEIVNELIACLNFEEGNDIAVNLNNLYRYVIDLLIKANIQKSIEPINEAISIIKEIREAWMAIGKEVQMNG
ncbi:MAG: flagellar export chaperone FliS [Candidatus Pristimantibacillus lignocellulolyticus]|uniref:Flagellar secretion chaperone FliS n=1 Tax=Candidatus Pristimantibacillus lignocellulolyticus TaxID=2994561 RepID=A0A9J6ZK83_9BACL|nr:MAG: flagellar export chaperone FliS [Candidatus Pristimantibacillus lignocellulolyticus]